MKQNYACSACKGSLLQTCYSVLCQFVHLCACVILQGQIYIRKASQPTTKTTGCEILLYIVLYTGYSGVGILARKNKLFLNWYSFLDHEYSFLNAIVSRLIALKHWPLALECPPGFCPRPQAAKTMLCNHFFTYKTQSFYKKQALWLKCLDKSLLWYFQKKEF